MAGTVGGVTCGFVKGTSKPLSLTTEVWAIAGLNGIGAMVAGAHDSAFSFEATYFDATVSLVNAWAVTLAALQGSIVAIVDDWGTTHTGCLITNTSPVERTPYHGGVRGRMTISGVRTV